MIEYNLEPPSKLVELVVFKLPLDYNCTWIETKGDIIMKIPCTDGMFLLARLPWSENEDPKDRHPIRKNTVDMLD